MKRRYSNYFFLHGVIQNLIRYLIIGITGLVLLIIGLVYIPICKIIGLIVLAIYLLLSVIEQFSIRSESLKESDNPEFNQFMDVAFGLNKQDENGLSSHERIIKIVEDNMKSKNTDFKN